MKIADIREEIQALNWIRQDYTGGTAEENRRVNLPEKLAPQIAVVESLEIPARFARDEEMRQASLECAAKVIARWRESQLPTTKG